MADGIDDHRLRYLFAAVHHGSVRAAADALGVNSSVVSRQISLLEQGLDVVLLERHARGVRATEAGALLVEHFHRRAADRDDMLAKLRDIQGLRRGHIDIAIGEGFVSDLMSGSLRSFWKQHPRLTMSLRVGGTNDIVRWVAEDQVHIGLVYNPPGNTGIRSCASSRQPISLIAKRDHPLIRKNGPVSLRDVKEQPLGLLHASYGVRQIIAVAEAAEKIGLSPVFTTSSFAALGEFVKAGLGVTLLPAFSLAAEIASGALAAIPVRSPILTTPEAHVITRSGRELSNAAKSFLRHVTTQMRSFAGVAATRRSGR
jgi:DNA-binding transcriptional LysR family regulator